MIPDEKKEEIRDRIDIVALVEEYVPLKRSGSSFKGLCPFHPEKTPSFHVHPERKFFRCFGCQASGDVFSFLQHVEGRTFPDVARTLAERAGIELPSADPTEEARQRRARQRAERLAALMEETTNFYMRQLQQHELASMAETVLDERAVNPQTVRTFQLGYAPYGWDELLRFLQDRGWSPADAEELGLVVPRRSGRGHYDRFRHRLMFPVSDLQGRVVAFSGRVLDPPERDASREREPGPKYINSPETPLYKKGQVLFGLHEARVAIRRAGRAIVCEGNFDLLALHQAGFDNAVAPLGTALTEAQAKLLRRFAEEVILLFDGDRAGRDAAREAWPVLQGVGLAAKVAMLPPGTDPDGFVRAQGPEALRERIDAAPGVVEFLIDAAADDAGGDSRAKATAIAELGPVLAQLDNPVEGRIYVERIARRFGISDLETVRQQLKRGVRSKRQGAGTSSRPGSRVRGRGNGGRNGAIQNKAGDAEGTSGSRNDAVHHGASFPALERELVGALLDSPELFRTDEAQKLPELLTSPDIRAIFQAASRMVETRGAVNGPVLLEELAGSPALDWLRERLAIQTYDARGATKVLHDGLPRLARRNIERELPRMRELILQARRQGDDARAEQLTRERNALYLSSSKWMQGTKG